MAEVSATRKGVLNARQLRFVEEYLVDMNATQAAIRAGYSKRSAAEQGYDLLRHPQISLALAAKRKELSVATGVTVERVVKELSRIAFADTRKLFRKDSGGELVLVPVHELDDDTAAAIAGMKITERQLGPDIREIRLCDKKGALETLLKHLGADGDKPPADPAAALAAIPSAIDALAAKLDRLAPLREAA